MIDLLIVSYLTGYIIATSMLMFLFLVDEESKDVNVIIRIIFSLIVGGLSWIVVGVLLSSVVHKSLFLVTFCELITNYLEKKHGVKS